ncbi:Protein mms22 [Colletotrichum aenigma]|uniref:Protein mms22 n=1 Tax=Colletotrichum aenigma TaxID=1215731 RepID=UPI0018731A83|nr:Protein mms22 [Colletotrichum aenigma]KAF5526517.1 Protein mms22 [Colletotrichum aenigma]
MANWKELGEVPDSDDELDFDSQEFEGTHQDADLPMKRPDEALQSPQAPGDSVWDVPPSSQANADATSKTNPPTSSPEETRPPVEEPASSPLSSAQDVDDLADIFELEDLPAAAPPPTRHMYTVGGRDESPDPLGGDDSISTSYVKITAPPPAFPRENDTRSLSPPTALMASPTRMPSSSLRRGRSPAQTVQSLPRSQQSPPSSPQRSRTSPEDPRMRQESPRTSPEGLPRNGLSSLSSQPRPPVRQRDSDTSRDEQIARETAAQHARSFRPRKPIQQHPYLIENAQYSKVFKSHGLRPVRMPNEPAARRQRADEDSQEKDFEASQDSVLDGQNETTDESQSHGLEEPLSHDILRMSLSPSPSPLRTSSPKHKGGPSSQPSQDGETDNTSLSDNGDLPSIDEIFRKSTTAQGKKRRRLIGTGVVRSRPVKEVATTEQSPPGPTFQTYDEIYGVLSSSPLPPQLPNAPVDLGAGSIPPSGTDLAQVLFDDDDDDDPFRSPSPPRQASAPANHEVADITMADISAAEDDQPDFGDFAAMSAPESEDGAGSGPESESEALRNVGRRIRGVLPASWLRLDQQASRPKPAQQHHREPSPEMTQRRGVAVRRIGRSTSTTAASFIFDDSDEEPTSASRPAGTALVNVDAMSPQRRRPPVIELDDGDSSAMEDNGVDQMAPSRKRQMTLKESFRPAKRLKKSKSTSNAQPKKRGRPPKSASRSTTTPRLDPWVTTQKSAPGSPQAIARAKTPPRLSILDVIEPDAPQFLKVAARAAQSKRNLGRSSPRNKTIRLATRKDNVDAGTVLQKWKGNKIQPRQGLQRKRSTRTKPTARNPLAQLSTNVFSQTTAASPKSQTATQPARTIQDNDQVATPSLSGRRPQRPLSRQSSFASQHATNRPAQLETDLAEQPGRIAFQARKRALDALFRRSRSQSLSARSMHLDSVIDDACSVVSERVIETRGSPEPSITEKHRPKRSRKAVPPVRIDVAAAQFRYANDPLPTTDVSTPAEAPRTTHADNQLLGLGPFGTHYTQHFDTFPLDRGVFFHESTLIGSGKVDSAVDERFSDKLWESRPRVSFHLGEQVLRWDIWTEQVSSEFGILMDGMLDQVLKPVPTSEAGFNAKDAARFVLDYVLKSMSFTDDNGALSFVTRLSDVTRASLSRLDSELSLDSSQRLELTDVLSNLLLIVSSAVRLCQNRASLISETFTLENLLRKAAEALVSSLLTSGLNEVTNLYDNLQTLRYRERGIRSDKVVPHAWVVLMRVLESLRIPRMNFWDVTFPHLIKPAIIRGSNAQEFECLWKDMFTLLPLCEFDNLGVLIADKRHHTPVEGWNLPQQVLKRVFQLYRDNPRQSPSFNDYCRTLVARCHYLVEQWGWQKCSGIIGTIFDFFGSQNLSHLRNEEAFRSARFLDNLHTSPSLKVEAEDRCFHIFLKLVALVIKKLRKKDMVNDIRNLVTRTLPNHDRQYSKEQDVHAHDLAALRNHHDLLCTLFWAAPPDLRPPIHNLQKLVIPASSHKEACLINLRAWNQLARFVVHEESPLSFLPLANWQADVFKQLVDQYNSAAADMQRQFLAMPKDATNRISESFMNAIVEKNKAATMEIMLFSVKSSMDVVQYANSLELARLASSTVQLQHVFQHFSALPADFPSVLLQASLTTFERLIVRIEAVFNEDGDSQDSMVGMESEEAILMLERELAAGFFSMSRCILAYQANRGKTLVKSVSGACVEQCVVLSGMVSSLFVRCRMMQYSQIFKRNHRFGLFDNMPHKLSLEQRPLLPLFLSTVMQRPGDVKLDDMGIDLLHLWLLIIVQPNHCLRFENQLGQQMQRQGFPYVPNRTLGFVANPGYMSNRDFFEYAMKWMRQSLHTMNAAEKKKELSNFSKALDNAMQQMRTDLQVTANDSTNDSTEHSTYVRFVRNIISLITTYGTDICKVPPFFREVSKAYSPPAEDPELQVAKILSYGLKLAEGNTGIASSLFYLLLNNFKKALQLGRLPQQVLLLKTAMQSDAVVAFTLRMLSAVLHATKSSPEAYALLDVFCDALELEWNGSVVARQLNDDVLTAMSTLITSTLDWATGLRGTPVSAEHIHALRKIVWLVNTLQPTFESYSLKQGEVKWWDEVMERLDWFSVLVNGAEEYLDTQLERSQVPPLSPSGLFRRLREAKNFKIQDAMVLEWSRVIVDDVQRNWVVKGPVWTVPGSTCDNSSTQPARGTIKLDWDNQELVITLHDQLRIWSQWWTSGKKEPGAQGGFDFEDFALF